VHPTHQGALQRYQEYGKRCHVLGRSQCNKQTKQRTYCDKTPFALERMVLVVLANLEKLEEFPSLQQMDMGVKSWRPRYSNFVKACHSLDQWIF
jgi:hypothetical protein